ncbi:Acetyltransferase (GNAT) family protein [Paenibacillaceae bacterium GAS479]|nr:Acetyltransferase (GNAT) family protein [Paenibacillaceae bacterium GAS479]
MNQYKDENNYRSFLQVVQAQHSDTGMAEELSLLFHQYRQFYGHPDTKEQMDGARLFIQERLQRQDSIILVAIFGEERIGFAQLYPVFSSLSMRRAWILNDLYIDEGWRGKGAARKLLQAAEQHARDTGAAYIQLSTAPDNKRARQLYESQGYVLEQSYLTYELGIDPR